MNRIIWKYELETTDRQKLIMPAGAEILTVQTQREKPCLWALVNPKLDNETRYFEIFGTGHTIKFDIDSDKKYIGTYQLQGGSVVFHVFEYIP